MAEEMIESRMAKVMGEAIDLDPMEALLWCVRITAGEVAYAAKMVSDLTEDQAIVRPISETERDIVSGPGASYEKTTGPEELNLWIKVRQQATERLAKFSKMALDAGVAVRQVELAETAGDQLALAIRTILDGLGLSVEQESRAPMLVRNALVTLEKGPAGAHEVLEQT